MNLLHKYNRCLKARPLATKMVTNGALGAMGDLMCQYFEKSKNTLISYPLLSEYDLNSNQVLGHDKDVKKRKINLGRTLNFTLMGTFFSAPILHLHFTKLLPFVAP